MSPPKSTRAEVENGLREAFASDPETSLRGAMLRSLVDPAIAPDRKRRFRLHPLVVTLVAIFLCALATFICFSFSRY